MEKRMQLAKGNDLLVTAISFIFFRVCVVVCSAALLPFAFPFRWPLALHHPIVLVLFCFLSFFFRKSSLAGHRPSAPWPCVMEIKSHISGAQVYIAYSLKRKKKKRWTALDKQDGTADKKQNNGTPYESMNKWTCPFDFESLGFEEEEKKKKRGPSLCSRVIIIVVILDFWLIRINIVLFLMRTFQSLVQIQRPSGGWD